MNKKKRGRIKISKTLYFRGDMPIVFKYFLPILIENELDYFMLWGFSECFEEIEDGCIAPFYEAIFTQDAQNNPVLLKFKKIE